MNFTISVPEGTQNHGNPRLLCTPPKWYDYLLFFFANYFAHAGSIVLEPGQSLRSIFASILLALTLPGSGVFRAVSAILRHAATETKNPLKRATRAGALCLVLKMPTEGRYVQIIRRLRHLEEGRLSGLQTDRSISRSAAGATSGISVAANANEEPSQSLSEEASQESLTGSKRVTTQVSNFPWWQPPEGLEPVPGDSVIHGKYWLHEDYYLAKVPLTASLDFPQDDQNENSSDLPNVHSGKATLASSYNLLKLFIGLVQAVWAIVTLYRARGDQIQQFGFAAFGLTVAPYAFMSILNTLANILNPEYPAMFVIRTPMLDQVEREKMGSFNGAVCVELKEMEVTPEKQQKPKRLINRILTPVDKHFFPMGNLNSVRIFQLGFLLSLVPLAVVGGLSGFRHGDSSHLERGFTMSWLVVGIVYGSVMWVLSRALVDSFPESILGSGEWNPLRATLKPPAEGKTEDIARIFSFLGVFAYLGVPAIGGMVMVGKMIHDFGICTLVS